MTPLEEQLQQYFPDIYKLYLLMKPTLDGPGETKLLLLINALVHFNQQGANGSIMIEYQKGKINHIDTRIRITANTASHS